MSGVVYQMDPINRCNPGVSYTPCGPDSPFPSGSRFSHIPGRYDYPRGTVWECDCGQTWVSRGFISTWVSRGFISGGIEWKRERRWARKRRLKKAAT